MWAESTTTGARWGCYDESGCGGELPDQDTTVLAAAMTVAGSVTFGSRAELARLLEPEDEESVLRRGRLLDGALRNDDSTTADHLAAVRAAMAEGGAPIEDEQFVQLAMALNDYAVRDICLGYALGPQAAAAERLWLTLIRALPAPERAEPAVLLALSAYLRGDGSLANIALEQTEEGLPGHNLAILLRNAIGLGLPPERMRLVVAGAVADAEVELAATTDDR